MLVGSDVTRDIQIVIVASLQTATTMKILGVEYAPLIVPLHRRLETLAAAGYVYMLSFLGPTCTVLLIYTLFFTSYFWLGLIYIAYAYGQRNAASKGACASKWVREWAWWRYNRDFFPAKMFKTADLDPKQNYVLGVFPHGVFASGVSLGFGTEALGVSKVFPGLRPSIITLEWNFKMPGARDLLLALGACSASRESLDFLLSDPAGGRAAVLIIGGAAEAMGCRPGSYHIVLKNRKGFVKLAIKNGASLVPVFTFGENELYDQVANPEGSWLRWVQDVGKKYVGIALILVIGRGLFQYTYGVLPRRRPLNVVVGRPIQTKKVSVPTQTQIDEVHQRFMDGLMELFEEHKHKYCENPKDIELIIG